MSIIKDTVAGAVTGGLTWASSAIKNFVVKIKDGKLAFIQDPETIALVKEQYHSGELSIYKAYIKEDNLLFLLKMGLTLRKLGENKEENKRRNLRSKIFEKYRVRGLHISEFVENGILNRYIGILIENIISVEKFKEDIMEILNNIDKHVLFVKIADKERDIIQKTLSITNSLSPMIFIVSGMFSAALTTSNCEKTLVELLKDYRLEKMSSAEKENLFFKRILR